MLMMDWFINMVFVEAFVRYWVLAPVCTVQQIIAIVCPMSDDEIVPKRSMLH